jgi:hypothetical protein
MKFVLKEKNMVREQAGTNTEDTKVLNIKPEIFLELTMPKDDWTKVRNFIGLFTSQFPEHKAQAEEIYKSLQPGEIGDEVISRAFTYFKKQGGYKLELATSDGPTPCSLAIQAFPTAYVTSHSGRARACMAAMSGIKSLSCSITCYGQTIAEVVEDKSSKYLNGQKFGRDPINSVLKKNVFGKMVK